MCEPTTLTMISLGLSAAGAAASYVQQGRMADAQADAILENAALQANDLARQQQQQAEAGAAEMNEAARKARADAALFDVISGEYGGGVTAQRGAAVRQVQSSESLATIGNNYRTLQGETGFRGLASGMQARSQLNAIQQPSLVGTALTIGGAAIDARKDYIAATNPRVK